MAALVILVAGPLLAAAAYLMASALRVERVERNASLLRALRYGSESAGWSPARPTRLVNGVANLMLRLLPAADADRLARRLRAAGLARRISLQGFLVTRLAVTGGFLALGVSAALAIGVGRGIVLVLALGAVGYALPGLVVATLARHRRRQIAPALPDALDLIAVCVAAGLGLDAAIQQLTEQTSGPLADELDLALSEMRVGASRQEALRNLANRLDIPELTKAVRSIAQAEQQGSALARTLGILACEARERRQVVAEGEANKAPVKMLFPTVGFIFPALFIVVLGPALLTIYQSL